jgi:hypothetical protein
MDRFMIEGVTASRWILEYIKFIVLSTLSKSELFPSDIVDRVWHLHMTYTKHYREMIKSIEGVVPEHTQECCHKVDDGDQRQVYEDTLTFYEAVFKDSPPEDIWPDSDIEFTRDKDKLMTVNLYRLFLMHYVSKVNELFLTSNDYKDQEYKINKNINTPEARSKAMRRIRRQRVPYKDDPLNWRRNYKVFNIYKTVHDKNFQVPSFIFDREGKELDKISKEFCKTQGADFLVCGGLAIFKNAFHAGSITNTNYAYQIISGFYPDLFKDDHSYDIDDIADCALASSDVIFMVPEMLNTCRFLRVNNVKNDLAVNRKMLLLKASEMKVHPDEYYEEYNSDDDMSNSSADSIAEEHA